MAKSKRSWRRKGERCSFKVQGPPSTRHCLHFLLYLMLTEPVAASAAAVAEPVASTSRPPKAPPAPASRHLIREGDNVLIKLPSGVLKAIKINIKA